MNMRASGASELNFFAFILILFEGLFVIYKRTQTFQKALPIKLTTTKIKNTPTLQKLFINKCCLICKHGLEAAMLCLPTQRRQANAKEHRRCGKWQDIKPQVYIVDPAMYVHREFHYNILCTPAF